MSRSAIRDAAALSCGRTYAKVLGPRAEPELSPFPCALLCMECRYLSPPAPARDPMRTDGQGRVLDPCPRCGETAWADLRNVDMRRAVGQLDADVRERRGSFWSGALLYGAALAVCSAGIWLVGTKANLVGTICAAICFAPILLAPLLSSAFARRVGTSKKRRTPARWHRPFVERPRGGVAVEGAAVADELLTSPLTGRPCVAYEVGVRRDGNGEAADVTWELIDQRSVAMTVGGTAVQADRAWVAGDRLRVEPSPVAVAAYLVQHGLEADPSGYVFFESVIEPGAPCRLSASGQVLEPAGC